MVKNPIQLRLTAVRQPDLLVFQIMKIILITFVLCSACFNLFAADVDFSGWDKSAASYFLATGSESPDGKYGVAYPKASEDNPKLAKNYIVALKPFRVLTVLEDDGLCVGSKRLGLTVEWTPDSSKVIVTTKHDKWDMIVGSSLVSIRDGAADQRVNLLNAINREMAPDFRKSKAEAYNDELPFILTESKIGFADQGKNVRVKTAACNDPNEARKIDWSANFDGLWSIAESKWLTHQLTSQAKKNTQLDQ